MTDHHIQITKIAEAFFTEWLLSQTVFLFQVEKELLFVIQSNSDSS